MPLKFYYDLISQPSRAVYLFLRANGIPHIDKPVALRKGEHFSKEFEEINPFKKVPAIDHDGFKLSESVAILRYLSRTYKVPDHWYPQDSQSQAMVDVFLEWYHTNIRLTGGMYFQTKILLPMMKKEPPDEKLVNYYERGLKKSLSDIENIFLAKGPYLMGRPQISIADLMCMCELEQPWATGYNIYDGHPKLLKWSEHVTTPLMPDYNEAHSIIHKLRSQVANPKTYQFDE